MLQKNIEKLMLADIVNVAVRDRAVKYRRSADNERKA